MTQPSESYETATFGAGCFWCTEAVFSELKGVSQVVSGYAGGELPNPSYEQISSGTTGHAEVAQVQFDPHIISYLQLLEIFFLTHDPTTRNRQGQDVGTQYRSVIFYHSEKQKRDAIQLKQKLEKDHVFPTPIVTEIEPFQEFYPAETYHQEYYARNSDQPYCQVVINPKINKLRAKFAHLLKT